MIGKTIFGLLVIFLVSCASSNGKADGVNTAGTVEVRFETHNEGWDTVVHPSTEELVSLKLLEEAKKKYSNNTVITNIKIEWVEKPQPKKGKPGIVRATGIVLFKGDTGIIARIEFALNNVADKLIADMPADATIAILSVYSADRQTAEYVINELEYKLFESKKCTIVDRRRLEQIRREQNFQMSGEVDDASAVSIGNMLGATIVLTGDITTDARGGLLVVRALDVQTARIIMMARERF